LSEKEAIKEGYKTEVILSPAPDKAHFYPTAKPIMIKMVVDKNTRKLLGMQAVGMGDIDKRIDVAITAITAGMTLEDISNLDLAYAPPFSPAIDNIITASNVGRNKLDDIFSSIGPIEVKNKLDNEEDFVFLDVRTSGEYDQVSLKGSTLMPLGKLRKENLDIPKDKEIITFCKISLRGYEAALILKEKGYTNVKVMDGGVLMWPYDKIC
jgi:rhodanese-related sulfurtransferase